MRNLCLLIGILSLFGGCVTRHMADDFSNQQRYFDRINKRAGGKGKAKIILTNNVKVKTDSLFVTIDSVHYRNKKDSMVSIHNAFVEKVVFFKRGKGVLQGLVAGPIGLTAYSIIVAFSDPDNALFGDDEKAFRSFGEFLGFVTITAAAGAGLGLIIGTINGQRVVFPIRKAYQKFNKNNYRQRQ